MLMRSSDICMTGNMRGNALARLQEPAMEPARYQPPDELMRFLLNL